jgi:hypothetical protein
LGRKSVPLTFDASSHGTHIAALLLQIAPDCDVYVGRVADASGKMVAPDKIAEVRSTFTCAEQDFGKFSMFAWSFLGSSKAGNTAE